MTATILLIQPPIEDFYLTKKRTIPYGLISIAAQLSEAGFSVKLLDALATAKSRIIDPPKEMDYLQEFYGAEDQSPCALFHHYRHYGYAFQHIARLVRECAPFLVGISSLFSPYAESALMTAKIVKKELPECTIVLGGHHPTAMPEHVMACTAVDFVLRGDGEVSLPLLAHAILDSEKCIENIPGIVYRQPEGALHISPPDAIRNLDDLAAPAACLLNFNYYQRQGSASYVIAASRGCPFQCSYCSMGNSGVPFRKRSVKSVLQEMTTAVETFNARFIDFEDENISFDRTWFRELLHAVIRKFGSSSLELRAMNGLFPPSLDSRTVSLMRDAGFRVLNLSLGTTSKAQLKRFNRPELVSAFEHALALAEALQMEAVGYIIVGAPHQDPFESVDDLLYLAQQRVLAGVSVFYPAPGSHDYGLCSDLGILPGTPSLFRSSALPVSHKTSRKDAVTLLRLSRILNFVKAIVDQGMKFPDPLPFDTQRIKDCSHKFEIGKILLQGFLHDGSIRGITNAGRVYEHSVSTALTHSFIQGLRRLKIRGVNRGLEKG